MATELEEMFRTDLSRSRPLELNHWSSRSMLRAWLRTHAVSCRRYCSSSRVAAILGFLFFVANRHDVVFGAEDQRSVADGWGRHANVTHRIRRQ